MAARDLEKCSVRSLVKSGELGKVRLSANFQEKIFLFKGDITKIPVDAVVNAANKTLLGGGGVDGAIHRAAGPRLKEECQKFQGKGETGKAYITKGYNLPAECIIHTIGPVYSVSKASQAAGLLSSAYRESLDRLTEQNLTSIAFPSISTGVYGYPIADATEVALKTVLEYLSSPKGQSIVKVVFCTYSDHDRNVYLEQISKL